MHAASSWPTKARTAAVVLVLSLALSGCFDLAQKVAIDRTGSGNYQIAITAQGIVGEALKEKPVDLEKHDHAVATTREENGKVTQTSTVAFKSLADLRLNNELMSLTVLSHSFFGLGPAHVRFRRTLLVDNARRANADRMGDGEDMGKQVLASMFGGHTYSFSVTVPGSILRIAVVKLNDGTLVAPTVTGDFYHGHTVTWTMPLDRMLGRKMLSFEVDFSAYGSFADVHSTPEAATSL